MGHTLKNGPHFLKKKCSPYTRLYGTCQPRNPRQLGKHEENLLTRMITRKNSKANEQSYIPRATFWNELTSAMVSLNSGDLTKNCSRNSQLGRDALPH